MPTEAATPTLMKKLFAWFVPQEETSRPFQPRSASPESRQPAVPEDAEGKTTLVLAMIALKEKRLPQLGALSRSLAARTLLGRTKARSMQNDRLEIEFEGGFALVQQIDAPLPAADLSGPMQTSDVPPDEAVLLASPAHALVTVTSRAASRLDSILQLTHIAGALAEQTECAAVYWGAGSTISSASFFADLSRDTSRDSYPFSLWLTMHWRRDAEQKISVTTQGLSQFELPEIEILRAEENPIRLHKIICFVATYLIDHGAILNDGDTVNIDKRERLGVHRRRSASGANSSAGELLSLEIMSRAAAVTP